MSRAYDLLQRLDEVSPPGWSGTVEKMKTHKEISNPFALAWYMRNKGDKSHYTKSGRKRREKRNG